MKYVLKDFGRHLKKSYGELRTVFEESGTDCMRVYDRNISELPCTVDLFGGSYVRIVDCRGGGKVVPSDTEDDEPTAGDLIDTAARMLYVPAENVRYVSNRGGREWIGPSSDSPNAEWRGRGAIKTREHGLTYLVRPDAAEEASVGLRLDLSLIRSMLIQESFGKTVLNLFPGDGDFSVAAAAGGAKSVLSAALSDSAAVRIRANMAANRYGGQSYRCETASDPGDEMHRLLSGGAAYDLVLLPMPGLEPVNFRGKRLDIAKMYTGLIKECLELTSGNGAVLFVTHLPAFHFDRGRLTECVTEEITGRAIPPGFSFKRKTFRCWVVRKK